MKAPDLKRFALLLALLSLPLGAVAQDLVFAVLTDTHIGREQADGKLKDAIESINLNKDIQFVLHLGDISDHGTTEELFYAKELLSNLRKPLHFTTGNHDARWPERREAFIKVFKKDRFCFVKDGVRFIGCCTGPYEAVKRARIKDEDLGWIGRKCRKERPTVVALHYPHGSIHNREDVDKALEGSDTILWLAGHLRLNSVKSEDPYPCLVNISQLEDAKYNLVSIKEGRLSIEVVSPREGTVSHWYDRVL